MKEPNYIPASLITGFLIAVVLIAVITATVPKEDSCTDPFIETASIESKIELVSTTKVNPTNAKYTYLLKCDERKVVLVLHTPIQEFANKFNNNKISK